MREASDLFAAGRKRKETTVQLPLCPNPSQMRYATGYTSIVVAVTRVLSNQKAGMDYFSDKTDLDAYRLCLSMDGVFFFACYLLA